MLFFVKFQCFYKNFVIVFYGVYIVLYFQGN